MSIVPGSMTAILPRQQETVDFATQKYNFVKYECEEVKQTGTNTIYIDPPENCFVNLYNSRLTITGKITKADGSDLDYVKKPLSYSNVSIINCCLWTLFRNFCVFIGKGKSDILFQSYHGHYGLVNYIKTLKKEKRASGEVRNIGFSLDTVAGPAQTAMGQGNQGITQRGQWFFESKSVTFSGPLSFPAAQENFLLPNGIDLVFEMDIASDSLNLLIPEGLIGANKQPIDDIYYKFKIENIAIDLCQVMLQDQAFLGYQDAIAERKFSHFFTDYEIKVRYCDF